ncbi:hypothetical protein BX600DRAFT_387663 [Xylariales sp. PMI_506]|nr:hypothetical protein BX600DRAFT_387663 [Xylariales sp. PMI_506]
MAGQIRTVGVIGTGVIGASWTTLFLAHGIRCIVSDPAPKALDNLRAYIKKEWPVMEKLGLKPGADPDNFEFVQDVADHLDKIELVQENAPENPAFKTKLFGILDDKAPESVILASSSSGLPSSSFIGNCKKASSRVLIGHPVNPPHLIPLVEIVPHPGTSSSVVQAATDFYTSLGKRPVKLSVETPGFVMNRLQVALGNEVYSLVARGVISASDVDAVVTSGLGLRWALTGPLMTNALGGGGGSEGFKHMVEHLGPAASLWTKDMKEHAFTVSADAKERIFKEVRDMMAELGSKDAEEELVLQRDEALVDILKLKREKKYLI